MYAEYEKLWTMITQLKTNADSFDSVDSKLQVWNEIQSMMDDKIPHFLEVTTADKMISLLENISDDAGKVNKSVLKEDIEKLQTSIADTIKRIETVKQ